MCFWISHMHAQNKMCWNLKSLLIRFFPEATFMTGLVFEMSEAWTLNLSESKWLSNPHYFSWENMLARSHYACNATSFTTELLHALQHFIEKKQLLLGRCTPRHTDTEMCRSNQYSLQENQRAWNRTDFDSEFLENTAQSGIGKSYLNHTSHYRELRLKETDSQSVIARLHNYLSL